MQNRKSIASALIFLGSALCFFLPFVTVSCGGMKAFTLTGQQLATGTTLSQPQPFGPPQSQKIDGDVSAAIAGICALAGIVLSLVGRRMAGPSAVSGAIAAASLLVLRNRLEGQIQKQGEGLASVSFEMGYTLTLLLLIVGIVWNVYLFLQERRVKGAVTPER